VSRSKDALHLNVPYQVRDKLLNSLEKSVFFNDFSAGCLPLFRQMKKWGITPLKAEP
jgi:hypothetical protein